MDEQRQPNINACASTLIALAQQDPTLLVVVSDSRISAGLRPFNSQFPDRLIDVGIAEQNLVGVAAGLASIGARVCAVAPAAFLVTRAAEQIRNDIAWNRLPVCLVGVSSAVSYGTFGYSHYCTHDIALLRTYPHIQIYLPSDRTETHVILSHCLTNNEPAYVRLGKSPVAVVSDDLYGIIPGKARQWGWGTRAAILACGEMVQEALGAMLRLVAHGLDSRVLGFHTLKPLDIQAAHIAFRECDTLVIVEEHAAPGGLGEAVCKACIGAALGKCVMHIAYPEQLEFIGSEPAVREFYGLTSDRIVDVVLRGAKSA